MQHAYNNGLRRNVKIILQYNTRGHLIKEWPSIMKAQKELNINSANICNCCKGKIKAAGGYIWRYKDTQ